MTLSGTLIVVTPGAELELEEGDTERMANSTKSSISDPSPSASETYGAVTEMYHCYSEWLPW